MQRRIEPTLSVVIPVYNEAEVMPILLERLTEALRSLGSSIQDYEIVFVNDGSSDGTPGLLQQWVERDSHVVAVNFSRNFGQQPAISAGLSTAAGEVIVIMDADLQDPPELIPEMLEAWRNGAQVVIPRRRSRKESGLRRLAFDLFPYVFEWLSDYPIRLKSGVFGLMDRVVVDELNRMTERHRFLPGLFGWVGFRQVVVWYDRSERAAGQPKQSLRRLLRYGFDAIFSFSYKPLRLSLICGVIVSFTAFTYATILLTLRLLNINVVRGFTTPTVAILFLGGVQLIGIGILGEYLGRIYDEVKLRPLYVVDEVWRHSRPQKRGESGARLVPDRALSGEE
ncbi:MAG: glycosyltransferase family 2 protein [Vicinamibacteria bacterium]